MWFATEGKPWTRLQSQEMGGSWHESTELAMARWPADTSTLRNVLVARFQCAKTPCIKATQPAGIRYITRRVRKVALDESGLIHLFDDGVGIVAPDDVKTYGKIGNPRP